MECNLCDHPYPYMCAECQHQFEADCEADAKAFEESCEGIRVIEEKRVFIGSGEDVDLQEIMEE